MAYSCAYFTHENESLASAEENKLKLTTEKLELKEGEKLLDIGSGWGSMLFYAAENYECEAIGITLAKEQVDFVNKKAIERGLENKVFSRVMHAYDMQFEDNYFDKVVSIGAIEHMEDLSRTFIGARQILKDDGLFLVHGMTQPWERRKKDIANPDMDHKELVEQHWGIGILHSLFELIEALERTGFEVLDLENITRHYQYTVERWYENLVAAEEEICGKIVPEATYREFVAAMASYIVGFEFSGPICQQILCQKVYAGGIRPIRPFLRTAWRNDG